MTICVTELVFACTFHPLLHSLTYPPEEPAEYVNILNDAEESRHFSAPISLAVTPLLDPN
jgi:hypothetical protein